MALCVSTYCSFAGQGSSIINTFLFIFQKYDAKLAFAVVIGAEKR